MRSVEAKIIGADDSWLRLRWRIEGAQALVVPPFAGKGRADELWKTTCFELFLRPGGGASYCEFNLSPSERWATMTPVFAETREVELRAIAEIDRVRFAGAQQRRILQ